MWAAIVYLQNFWPFSSFKFDDLRASDAIVRKLPIPESTRNFVYAAREPKSGSVIYVLLVQNLSQKSSSDADCLIRAIKPDAVVVQVGNSNSVEACGLSEFQAGHSLRANRPGNGVDEKAVPTSAFEVLKKCFMFKINREEYENVAGDLVLREIFGVCFDEHIFTAKKAAEEAGSSFFMLQSPFMASKTPDDLNEEEEIPSSGTGLSGMLPLQTNSFVSRVGTTLLRNPKIVDIKDPVQHQMVKSLSSYLSSHSLSASQSASPVADYKAPQYAKYLYPLLVDLHDIFLDLPSMGTALACAQKMLSHVDKGESVDNQTLSEVYAFEIAVEGLRMALTNAGRIVKSQDSAPCEFSDLPFEDQSQAIFAQALRSQMMRYKSVVAVVDASGFSGLRKHWQTIIPPEVKGIVDQLVVGESDDAQHPPHLYRKRLLSDKPMVAVGAGATAIFGASYLSKLVPFSTYIKLATLHLPSSLQLVSQKALGLAFGKVAAPSKALSALKVSALKSTSYAGKIRAVTHSMIASAEKSSLSAMRTALYEIMRRRRSVGPFRPIPWVTFGGSVAVCAGLLVYGDGIECAAESVPAAPSIANLGRGIRSLQAASQAVRPAESSRIQKSIESLLYKFSNLKRG